MIDYEGKIIVVAGPTGSGKSDIALHLAKDINAYIINGDSRQVYKDLNIGIAKPKFDKQVSDGTYLKDGIKHYLFNMVNPDSNFSLYEYQLAVKNVLQKEKGIPILVGGTGLYIDSVLFNYNLLPNDYSTKQLNPKTVDELQHIAKDYLNDMNESDRGNKHRLIRAIERGGINRKKGKELNNIYFVMDIEKEILKERVTERIDMMFKNGLLEENISLLEKGYRYEDKGMNSIGYVEFQEYFNNEITLEQVKERILKNTLSYIKRQRTWFKRNTKSIYISKYEDILTRTKNFLNQK